MDWTSILTTLIGAVLGGGAVGLATIIITRNSVRRRGEAEADHEQAVADHEQASAELEKFRGWEAQIERMNAQIEMKDLRIEKLNAQLAQKEERFNKQVEEYRDQTRRLRECQDREYQANAEKQRLSEKVAYLTDQLSAERQRKCHRRWCLDRMPRNDDTRRALAAVSKGCKIEALLEARIVHDVEIEDVEPLTEEETDEDID